MALERCAVPTFFSIDPSDQMTITAELTKPRGWEIVVPSRVSL